MSEIFTFCPLNQITSVHSKMCWLHFIGLEGIAVHHRASMLGKGMTFAPYLDKMQSKN